MRHEHPLTATGPTLELIEVVRRGGTTYPVGYQFVQVGVPSGNTVAGKDRDGDRVVLPTSAVKRVAEPAPERPRPTLAELMAAGLVKRGSES